MKDQEEKEERLDRIRRNKSEEDFKREVPDGGDGDTNELFSGNPFRPVNEIIASITNGAGDSEHKDEDKVQRKSWSLPGTVVEEEEANNQPLDSERNGNMKMDKLQPLNFTTTDIPVLNV